MIKSWIMDLLFGKSYVSYKLKIAKVVSILKNKREAMPITN